MAVQEIVDALRLLGSTLEQQESELRDFRRGREQRCRRLDIPSDASGPGYYVGTIVWVDQRTYDYVQRLKDEIPDA